MIQPIVNTRVCTLNTSRAPRGARCLHGVRVLQHPQSVLAMTERKIEKGGLSIPIEIGKTVDVCNEEHLYLSKWSLYLEN